MKSVCLAALLFLMVTSTAAFSGEIIKFSTMKLPPWGFSTDDGKPTGIVSDLTDAIIKEMGVSYTNKIVPYKRMLNDLKTNKADAIILFRNDKLNKYSVSVAPIMYIENIVVGLKGSSFKSLSDLHGKTVAGVGGANYDDKLTNDKAIRKHPTRNYQTNIRMVINKRLHAMVGPSVALFFTAAKMGHKREAFGVPLVLNKRPVDVYFSKKSAKPEIVAKMRAAIEQLHRDGTVYRILQRYQQL